MNIIGLDPSINSTGMVINGKIFNFSDYTISHNKKSLKKWYKLSEDTIDTTYLSYNTKEGSYQENELVKLQDYNTTTDLIIEKILKNIDKKEDTIVGIESYSYGSNYGDIIDLVTFSTLLRFKILKNITSNIVIIPPTSLKLASAKLTYEPIVTGTKKLKYTYRNNYGMSGGNFTKREMFLSIVENTTINDDYYKFLCDYKDDILSVKMIQKPLEDCNDAYLIYQILKNNIEI